MFWLQEVTSTYVTYEILKDGFMISNVKIIWETKLPEVIYQ